MFDPALRASETTLLPCPFCGSDGGEETIVDINEGAAYTPWYQAGCRQCNYWLPGARQLDEAVAAWNRRAPSLIAADARNDALQKRCDEGFAAHSRSFGALQAISMLTDLQGEVDDYEDVVKAVERLIAADADRTERVAEAIYNAMREPQEPEGNRYPWVSGGNSLKQDEARRRARVALDGA